MGAVKQPRRYTREEFLAWETEQDGRWELLDGVIKMMAGGSVAHNRIAGNVFMALQPAALRRGCEAFQQNQKLAPDGEEDVVYPDVFVTCRTLRGQEQLVGGASVVVEVVSKTSGDDDHRRKLRLYQELPELRHYLVVESDRRQVTHFFRQDGSTPWQRVVLTGGGDSVLLPVIEATLSLAEIYSRTDLLP